MKNKKVNLNLIKIKTKQSSDSSSEMSIDNNSEMESNSFIIQKRKKNKKATTHFIETSPNMRFSRQEEKKYSDKHMVSYLGLDHDRGCDVIWNVINISSLTEEQQKKIYNEFVKMKNLKHENINTISEVWLKDENSLVFITDSFFGGSIRQYLYKIGIQKLKVIKSWIKMILLGLDYLHKNGLIFRDLNCGRIYYNNNNGVVSLGDVIVSCPILYNSFNEKEYEFFPPNCMAPEIIQDRDVSEKADIYSLGMVLIEMITIEIPYSDFNLSRNGIIQKIKDGIKPSLLDRISDEPAKQFINKLIDSDPNKRPIIQNLLQDEFLKINDKEDNRKIKLIKIKKRNKKILRREIECLNLNLDNINVSHARDSGGKFLTRPFECESKKSLVPFKRDFEENPYFEESLFKGEKGIGESEVYNIDEKFNLINTLPSTEKNNKLKKRTNLKNEEKSLTKKKNLNTNYSELNIDKKGSQVPIVATSSHECGTLSKCCSDVYHTANTDYFNQGAINKIQTNKPTASSTIQNGNILASTTSNIPHININSQSHMIEKTQSNGKLHNTDESTEKIEKSEKLKKSENLEKQSKHIDQSCPPYQIFDASYNVHLKFLISQDGKLHEIQFTYNLLRDNIPDLMEEIQNEFNFSHDNLNHIYETLKKISIYSKFYKKSDILHDNSV